MARIKTVKGNHYAIFYDRERDPKEKSYPLRTKRKDVARRRLTKLERAFESGDFDPWNGGWLRETVDARTAVERFLEVKGDTVSERTLDTYRQQLEAMLDTLPTGGDLDTDSVTASDLRSYVFASDVSSATKCKRYRHVRAWANWCEKQGFTAENPISDLPKPKKEEKEAAWIEPEDVDRLCIAIEHHMETTEDAVGRTPDLQWLRDMIVVAVGTGLRRGELVALRWADANLEDGSIHVRHRDGFTTKGNRERRIPVVGDALDTLERMNEEREDNLDGPVFTDRNGKPVKPDRATKRFKAMAREAGLDERVHLHSLRHTTGAWLAMKGVPMRVIQSILGHSSVNVTERYSHLAPETLNAAMEETFGRSTE